MIPRAAIANPLSMIAVFAGLVEVGGTIVLPLLDSDIQAVYVWFLMGFPVFLVGLFFSVLYFRHTHLYAPSDFRDDESFNRYAGSRVDMRASISVVEDLNPETGNKEAKTDTPEAEIKSNNAEPTPDLPEQVSPSKEIVSAQPSALERDDSDTQAPERSEAESRVPPEIRVDQGVVTSAVARELENRFSGNFFVDIKDKFTNAEFDIMGETPEGRLLADVVFTKGIIASTAFKKRLQKFKDQSRSLTLRDRARQRHIIVLVAPTRRQAMIAVTRALELASFESGQPPQILFFTLDQLPLTEDPII